MNKAKLFFILIFIFLVHGCGPNYTCYDAENWGSPKFAINANPQSSYKTEGKYQMADWSKSGYYLNGKEIYFVVKNSYDYIQARRKNVSQSDYYRNINNFSNGAYNYGWSFLYKKYQGPTLNQIMSEIGMCTFCDTDPEAGICKDFKSSQQAACPQCPSVGQQTEPKCTNNQCSSSIDLPLPVTNAPCFLTNGLGAYAAFSVGPDTNPNVKGGLAGKPLHLGQTNISDSQFVFGGVKTSGIASEAPRSCQNGQMCGVNFKILDRHYEDNYGAVQVLMLSGVTSSNPGIITKIVAYIQSSLCWVKEEIFSNLVAESEFQNYVRALLVLYVIIYAISFLLGMVQVTQKDLMMRIVKIAIIVQLISPGSWEFFNDNFFMFFTQGIGEITGMLFGGGQASVEVGAGGITQASFNSACPCNFINVSGFEQLDNALDELLSQPTQAKLKAMIRNNMLFGTVNYFAMNGLFIYFIWIVIQSVFTYIMSYLGLTIIIILAPIFIPFMLFDFTKSFFSNWLTYLISYFIQPIVILTFTFFMFQIVMNQIHSLYGYTVCDTLWWEIDLSPIIDIKSYYWEAQLGGGEIRESIHIPNNFFHCADKPGCLGNIFQAGCDCIACQPYECTGIRNPYFPYLNPDNPSDKSRLTDFQNGKLGIDILDVLLLCFMMWFMAKFNQIVPTVAKDLAGTPMQMASMSEAGTALRGGLVATAGNVAAVGNELVKYSTGVDIKGGLDKFSEKAGKFREGIGKGVYRASQKVQGAFKGAETLSVNILTGKPFIKAGAKAAIKVAKLPADAVIYGAGKGLEKLGAKGLGGSIQDHTDVGGAKNAGGVNNYLLKGMGNTGKSFIGSKPKREKGYLYSGFTSYQDKIGGLIDTVYQAPKRALSSTLHKYTLGVMGKDYRSTAKGREEDDKFWKRTAEQHRINMESKFSGKVYDSYVRRTSGGRIHGDTGSSGRVVGGRRNPPPNRATRRR